MPSSVCWWSCLCVSFAWHYVFALGAEFSSCVHHHGYSARSVKVTFMDKDGNRQDVDAPMGENILEVAHANNIDLEG
jgi:hypothetical protein